MCSIGRQRKFAEAGKDTSWLNCLNAAMALFVRASDAGSKAPGPSLSGWSPKVVVRPLSLSMFDAGWPAGVRGCIPAKSAWHWQSSGVLSEGPSRALLKQPPSKATSCQARHLWRPRLPQENRPNLKAGQKTDGNPMSSQR